MIRTERSQKFSVWARRSEAVLHWSGAELMNKAATHRGDAVQRYQRRMKHIGARTSFILAIAVALMPSANAADGGAGISGVVRDAQGVAQMGALVQVLGANAVTLKTAFTDQRGRYMIANLAPGRYVLRASATLLVPAMRSNVQLRMGARAVVNLTLATLFDTTAWLPAQRRRTDEAADDWQWTLRSTASRPILRIVEDGSLIEVSSSVNEAQKEPRSRVRAAVETADGEFGTGGVHNILAIHRSLDDGGDALLWANLSAPLTQAVSAPSQELAAGYERRVGFDGDTRTVVSYMNHPELAAAGSPSGLEVFSSSSAQRMSLGEQVAVEVGGNMTAVHSSRSALAIHPFLRVSAHPGGTWTLHYRMSTDRTLQGFEDVTPEHAAVPVALVRNGRLSLESGRHQEASVEHKTDHGSVEVAYYHDAMKQTAVGGGGASGQPAVLPMPEMLLDSTTGSFKALATGYTTDGARVTVSSPLTTGLWVAAEYSSGSALEAETGPLATYSEALASLKAHTSQAATVALRGHLIGTGTRLRASYRWQPSKLVTAVDPFSGFADQAFFSCMLRQPIHFRGAFPKGMDATIDVTNLLAQGYRPFLSADGQTLYFAQSPRTFQAGLSFSF